MDLTNVVELFGAVVAGFVAGAIAMSRSRFKPQLDYQPFIAECRNCEYHDFENGVNHQKRTGHTVIFSPRVIKW